MSSDVTKSNTENETAGNQVELRISPMQTVCINFHDGEALPTVIQLLDPDSGQTVMFKSENGSYSEVEESSVLSSSDSQCCSHCCCTDEAPSGGEIQTNGDERLVRRREKLQRKLRERKASNKDDEKCNGHCHQILQIPVQGLEALRSTSNGQIVAVEDTEPTRAPKLKEALGKSCTGSPSSDHNCSETSLYADRNYSQDRKKLKAEDLKLHKAPEVEVLGCTSVKISWEDVVSNNGHLSECTFELQISSKNANFKTVYSGSQKKFQLTELKAGTLYKVRLCAIKDGVRGIFSPEASAQTPCAAPSTPIPPHLANKTKTNFLLKWTSPSDNGSPITEYKMEWDEGKGNGKFCEIYSGLQRQCKVPHKLPPGTPCVFRLKAVNGIGHSEFSKEFKCFTSAGVPSSPEPPQLDRAGVNYLSLSWSQPECNGAEITEYELDMEDESTGYGFRVAYRGLEKRFRVEKLRRNALYKFRLAATNSQGSSQWSDTAAFCTVPEKPGRPLPPVVQGKPKTSSFTIAWDAPSDTGGAEITKYMVEMDDGQGGPFTELYTGLDLEKTVEGLSPGHWYRLRVACASEGGNSDWSKIAKVRTVPVTPGKAKAPALSRFVKPQPNSIHVQWDPPDYDGGAEITKYILETENPLKGDFVEIYWGRDNVCAVDGLLPGKSYKFRVRAVNEAGIGKLSNVSELCTAAGPPDAPAAPETTCRSAAAIQVTWEAPEENGTPATGYCLEWIEDSSFVELYTGPERVCELRKGITPATFYYFRVKALSAAGSSPWSEVSTCQTPAASPAGVTSVKVIERSCNHLRLRWPHPCNNGAPVTSYNVEVAGVRNINFDVEPPDNDEDLPTLQEYSVMDLLPDTVYRIRVQAVNKIGCGPFSPTVTVTTGDLPPPAPILEVATASYQSLKLRWGPAKNENVGVTYTLQMIDKLGSFITIFDGATTSHKVNKLRERTEYKFRIQASNDAGTGPFSDIYTFFTSAQPPAAVKGLKAVDVSQTALTVRWDPVSATSSSDKIEYLLQCQCAGSGQDFVQVYQGPNTIFKYQERVSGNELRFRACAVRHTSEMNGQGSPNKGLKGTFTPVLTVRLVSPRKHKVSEGGSSVDEQLDDNDIRQTGRQLTDTQWALIFFLGFAVIALLLALVVPSLAGM